MANSRSCSVLRGVSRAFLFKALCTHELEGRAFHAERERCNAKLATAQAESEAAREEAAIARKALAEAQVAAGQAAKVATEKLAESQSVIDSLRLSLGEAIAKHETSTRVSVASATSEAELLALAALVVTDTRALALSLGATVAPPDISGEGDLATQMRAMAALGVVMLDAVPVYTLDCTRASAELALSCLTMAGCDHVRKFGEPRFSIPDRDHVSSTRECVRDLSHSFLHRVWGELGSTHLRALQRSRRAREVRTTSSTSAGVIDGTDRPPP